MKTWRNLDLKALAAFFLLLVSFAPQLTESVAVMSIDLGAEFMKIAIVKPGVPMEIVLNRETRRKTPLAVSLRNNEREFGEQALSQGIKSPKSLYVFLTQLLAKPLDSPAVKSFSQRYPYYDIRENPETKTIYFQHDESTTYTPEELLAMILEYARELASDFSEQSIDAAVISVPPYFNQAERKAVLRAAEIANLKILQLINTNIAAGLNYGVFRRKDFNTTGTTLMFLDMGSSGTVATVATFQMVKSKDDYEANPQLTIRGVGFDRTLGGNQFTIRLAKHLAKIFYEKTKKDVFQNPKATLKIYKEADRIKTILSANNDHTAQVEGLMDDVDFKAKVSREEFEQMCSDLFERIKNPIQDALKTSEVINEEISSVILVGAGTRIPKVQDEIMKASKKQELGKNLNTDEAPALGGVYQAAFQSKGYKVKKFYIKDVNLYPIVVDFERHVNQNEAEQHENLNVRRVLFERMNPYPSKKVMTFNKHTSDFSFRVNYGDLSFLDQNLANDFGSLNLTEINLKNVEDLFQKHRSEDSKGIKVHFKMDDSGVLNLDKIDVSFEKAQEVQEESTLSKIGNKISSFFGGLSDDETKKDAENSDSSENAESASTETPKQALNETSSNNSSEPASSSTASTTAKNATQAANLTVVRETVPFESVGFDYVEIGKEVIEKSKTKLSAIREREKEKKKRAAAINALEAFIFDTRDKLSSSEFIKCSTEAERESIGAKLEEADTWLSDADNSVETRKFTEKLTELKNACKDVFYRINEKKLRPRRLDELKEVLNKSVDFLLNVRNLTGEDLPLTQTEFNTLEKLINSTKEWRVKMLNEQAKLADHEQPKLLSSDIAEKAESLKREVSYLVTKIKYFRPKTTKKPATTSEEANAKNQTKNEEKMAKEENENKKLDEEMFDKEETKLNEDEQQQQQQQQEKQNSNDDETTTSTTDKPETTNNPEL